MPERDFTRGEKAFLAAYLEHGNREKAEKTALLAPRTGYSILARPDIQAEIARRQLARVTSDLVPKALDTLQEIMANKKAPAAARVQAAKVVLDRGLPSGESGSSKELHELTPDELAATISNLEALAASMAKLVSAPEETDVFA